MDQSELESLTEAVLRQIFVPLEASGRHVHITKEQALALFGHGLTPQRDLSQPGQFLARERVTVTGPKGEFANVAVLGPERKEAQVEVSLTDARHLGMEVPIRASGDVGDTPGCTLTGSQGRVRLDRGVIAARRHIHLTPVEARRFQVTDGQQVRLRVLTRRPLVFEGVQIRVREDFAPAAHLDFDEANACGFRPGDLGRIES